METALTVILMLLQHCITVGWTNYLWTPTVALNNHERIGQHANFLFLFLKVQKKDNNCPKQPHNCSKSEKYQTY